MPPPEQAPGPQERAQEARGVRLCRERPWEALLGSATLRLAQAQEFLSTSVPQPQKPQRRRTALTGGWPRYRDHDGLRQRVQVEAVGTRTLAAATASACAGLILRQTLMGREGTGT